MTHLIVNQVERQSMCIIEGGKNIKIIVFIYIEYARIDYTSRHKLNISVFFFVFDFDLLEN